MSASPVRVGWLALLDVAVVVAVLDYLALVIEAQHRHSQEREFLALLGLAAPPFDRGSVAGDDRLAEPAPSAVSSVCERVVRARWQRSGRHAVHGDFPAQFGMMT